MNPWLPSQIAGVSPDAQLKHRKEYIDPANGDRMTTYSIGFTDRDGNEVLIPTIVNGKRLTDAEAQAHYYATGQHFGKFSGGKAGIDASNRMGNLVHLQQQNDPLIDALLRFKF